MSEVICCVYWIRAPTHTDIFREGYVGISQNFEHRLNQHIYNSQNPKQWKNYRTVFREVLASGEYLADIILLGNRGYCLEIEQKLRPTWKIGWNIAKGGDGGVGTHGLSGSRLAKTYYNLITRARIEGEEFYKEWIGRDGLVNFASFYNQLPEGELTLAERGKGYNPSNLIKLGRSELRRIQSAVHDIGDGRLYSIAELSEKFDIRANTISTNLARGFTIRQAVGLDKKEKFKEFCYEKEMAVYYLWNSPMTHCQIGELVGLGKSTLRRQLKDYSVPNWLFSHCEITDRHSLTARRIPRNQLFDSFDDILDIEEAYWSGESIHSIAKRLGLGDGAIKKILEDLEYADYC